MKLSAKRQELADAFQLTSGAVSARTVKPILQNVKVSAATGGVELLATDLDVGMRLKVDGVEVVEEGEALMPAARVAAILKELRDEDVTMETDGLTTVITTSTDKYHVMGDNPAEYPEVANFRQDDSSEVSPGELTDMVDKTAFAVATEATRYAFNGILFVFKKDLLELVATDGRRLAYVTRKAKGVKEIGREIIVPPRVMGQFRRVVAPDDTSVKIAVEGNQILLQTARAVVTGRLVEGHFPAYDEVIPKDYPAKIKLDREAFRSGIRRAALLTNEESKAVKLAFAKKKLVLSARTAELGDARVEMAADYDGEAIEISFNPDFLEDVLKVLDDDVVTFELKDADSAGVLKAKNNYLYVIMPVKTA